MRLAWKLILFVLLAIAIISGFNGILRVNREIKFFRSDIQKDSNLLGHVLSNVIADTWKAEGMLGAQKMIDDVNLAEQSMRIRLVWLDAEPDSPDAPVINNLFQIMSDQTAAIGIEAQDLSGETRAYSYFPVPIDSPRPGVLEISESMSGLYQYTHQTVKRVIVLTSVLVLTSALAVTLIGIIFIGHPLRRIMERTHEIGAGHFSGHLKLGGHDELSKLAGAINAMSEQLLKGRNQLHEEMNARIEALEQLRHADRLRTVGRLSSGIAHELGTPLNVVSGRAGFIRADASASQEIIESANIIHNQCQRMTEIIKQLLTFARRRKLNRVQTDLIKIVSGVKMLLSPLASKHKVTLDITAPEKPMIANVDQGQMEQVLTNIIMNAIQAMPHGGTVSLKIGQSLTQPPQSRSASKSMHHFIEVHDEGIGISSEDIPHIFDPYFTTKSVSEGTGLGLSIAHGIVQEHGGWIDVSSEVEHGSRITVFLPKEETP